MGDFPIIDLFEGGAVSLDICEPAWLYAGRCTVLDTGQSWRFVYQTVLGLPGPLYRPLLDWLDGALPYEASTGVDPDMMFGRAELSLYNPAGVMR
jgi:hypothetical protein